jgi:hypothetical protein
VANSKTREKKPDYYPYHELDPTTPWYEWLCYCEICHQLEIPRQPHLGRFRRYREYLKEVGVM